MGREAQPPHSRLSPRLAADLHRMNFYRFCQLLEKRNPDRPLMGSTSHPADDPVRFLEAGNNHLALQPLKED